MLLVQLNQLIDGAAQTAVLHIDKVTHRPHVRIFGDVRRHRVKQRLLPARANTD